MNEKKLHRAREKFCNLIVNDKYIFYREKVGGDEEMTIGERIREIRLQNNMSLRDFAKVIGTANTTVMYWEKDKRKISFENAIKICDRFDVKLSWLAGLEE